MHDSLELPGDIQVRIDGYINSWSIDKDSEPQNQPPSNAQQELAEVSTIFDGAAEHVRALLEKDLFREFVHKQDLPTLIVCVFCWCGVGDCCDPLDFET